jgi:DNA-binding transcriptional LysR family regulator
MPRPYDLSSTTALICFEAAARHASGTHYGNPQDDGTDYRELFRDRIVALGTPAFAAGHGITRLEDLLSAPLIHLSAEETDWTTWAEWFQALGRPAPNGRSFLVNNYMIALQAAQDDVGAVLGWDGLVGGLVQEGRLVKLVPDSIPSPVPFHLRVYPRASPRDDPALARNPFPERTRRP